MRVEHFPSEPGPIGIFDSGCGGLTILDAIRNLLPEYDYLYLGDNARAPYGSRSFDTVCEYTRQAVETLFERGCHLVVLGCNTASAKALRTIQQNDLPLIAPTRRVLGVIRPTAEVIGQLTTSRHVGVLATEGTIRSCSYELEIAKLSPDITVSGVACPQWVPLVESHAIDTPETDRIVAADIERLMALDPEIDAIILGCTHYPLLLPVIQRHVAPGIKLIPQGFYVADALADYLRRHTDMAARCTRSGADGTSKEETSGAEEIRREGTMKFLTTEPADKFRQSAKLFLGRDIAVGDVETITLG